MMMGMESHGPPGGRKTRAFAPEAFLSLLATTTTVVFDMVVGGQQQQQQ